MKRILYLLLPLALFAQDQKPVATNVVAKPAAISKEALLEIQNIELREKPSVDLLQQLADKLLAATRAERDGIVIRECARVGLDARKGECTLDLNAGVIVDKRPKPEEKKKDPEEKPVKK